MAALITINWTVPAEIYDVGDYVRLMGNKGAGEIDYDIPLAAGRYDLFPDGKEPGIEEIGIVLPVITCGEYKFALQVYDSLGNPNTGSPQELEADIHIAPAAPAGLKKVSYDKDIDILILKAA